jgi:hypothetical protein
VRQPEHGENSKKANGEGDVMKIRERKVFLFFFFFFCIREKSDGRRKAHFLFFGHHLYDDLSHQAAIELREKCDMLPPIGLTIGVRIT